MTKKEFNQSFKLSVNGKFVGLENALVNTPLLLHRINKLFRAENDPKKRPVKYPVTMRISGSTYKLYAW